MAACVPARDHSLSPGYRSPNETKVDLTLGRGYDEGMNRKLTAEQAQSILDRVAGGELQKNLAAEFEVSAATISKLVRGLSWPELRRGEPRPRQRRTKLREEDIPVIRRRLAAREPASVIAKDYDVTRQAIADIGKGKSWAHVPQDAHAPPPGARRRRVWES